MCFLTGTAGEETGMKLGLGEECVEVSLLMLHGFNMGAEGFAGPTHWKLLDVRGGAVGTFNVDRIAKLSALQDRSAAHRKLPFHQMVLAFAKRQGSAACPESVVPDLSIVVHSRDDAIHVGLVKVCIFICLEIVVVNEPSHMNG
jgi:hypothetical protein